MPGMTSGLDATDPVLVAAFRSAMLQQLIIIASVLAVLLLLHAAARRWLPAAVTRTAAAGAMPDVAEPRARRLLRISFGLLWLLDGVLQAQPKMAAGLTSQVIQPVAASSAGWVQHVANVGATAWSYHPVEAAAAAIWIQAGLGLWMLTATSVRWSRLAGLASVGWGLIVWVFGEAFGGIFAPGLSWLSGAPGAVLIYVVAGALITLPLTIWHGPRAGRLLLAGIGLFWTGMAVLQAWPGRGFWQGTNGTLTGMVQTMAQSKQPHAQAAMVNAFARFNTAHPVAVNAFAVVALALLGAAFVSGRPRLLRLAVPAAAVVCLADWILVQDLGFLGGLGTDPNSMVPWLLLIVAGYVALTEPATETAGAGLRAIPAGPVRRRRWAALREALRPGELGRALGAASARSVAAFGALFIVLVGTAPMASALANNNADPIIAQAQAGKTLTVNVTAPGFRLLSQSGKPVSLESMRGKLILLTFLDPVCIGCDILGEELHTAGALLDPSGQQAEEVVITATPLHSGEQYITAFDRLHHLTDVPNWLFLTGPLANLQSVWHEYELVAPQMMTGMTVHSDVIFIIDGMGRLRAEVWDGPGTGTPATQSSFAVLVSDTARRAMG